MGKRKNTEEKCNENGECWSKMPISGPRQNPKKNGNDIPKKVRKKSGRMKKKDTLEHCPPMYSETTSRPPTSGRKRWGVRGRGCFSALNGNVIARCIWSPRDTGIVPTSKTMGELSECVQNVHEAFPQKKTTQRQRKQAKDDFVLGPALGRPNVQTFLAGAWARVRHRNQRNEKKTLMGSKTQTSTRNDAYVEHRLKRNRRQKRL
jgi:hypothetical protein